MAKPPAVYHEHQLLRFIDATNDVEVVAATTASISVIPAKAGYTVYVRRITGAITTSAAKTLTFQDTGNTPKPVGAIPASQATGSITVLDAMSKGVALQEGKGLSLVGSGNGPAGVFYIEAYYYQSAPLEPSGM